MSTMTLRVKYRPLRIGWCIRDGNFEDLRTVLRLTHTLWGGRYNPIIPISDFPFARQLINIFRVDVLYPAAEDRLFDDFIEKFDYLLWPFLDGEIFIDGLSGKEATLLDLYHPVRRIYEEQSPPRNIATLVEWDTADPLCDVMLASMGAFPSTDEIGLDYARLIEENLSADKIVLDTKKPLPDNLYEHLLPSNITTYELLRYRSDQWGNPGFYVGDSQDFTDLVNFWNLRAADIDLMFYDLAQAKRLNPLKESYLGAVSKALRGSARWDKRVAVWSKSDKCDIKKSLFGPDVTRFTASQTTWNGLNVKPPVKHFEDKSVLGSLADDGSIPTVSFQLPDKPFFDDISSRMQHVVVSVYPLIDIRHEDFTFRTPFIPELNKYYGRECYFNYNAARAEADGLGIITDVTNEHLTLHALPTRNLIAKVFEAFGMKAELSQAGLIANQLIRQMGGIQGCRVFKIVGVRELIEKYSPYQSFTRSAATQIIGHIDPQTGKPDFSAYESLFIEPRTGAKLKPQAAFTYLVKKGVFRVGLKFDCPGCNLEFWLPLDNVATKVICEYCGNEFNTTPQLKDRDWAYRRSGLFGREDHQEGGIPVALTLEQLHTTLDMDWIIYNTAMNIASVTPPINPCETDLVAITQSGDGRIRLVIGECKAGYDITEQDVTNLNKVADVFPPERFDVFIVFSKTLPFKEVEIERCRAAQNKYRYRVILLSSRELEPYRVYEKTAKEFDIKPTVVSLKDLAEATHNIFFEAKRKT